MFRGHIDCSLICFRFKYHNGRKGYTKDTKMNENELARIVLDKAMLIHRSLGPGLLESVYKECLFYELVQAGLYVEKERPLPLVYKDVIMECGYRLDLIVESKLVIEIKAVEDLADIHKAQTLTYLKLSGCRLALLINFNTVLLKDGIKRIINGEL